MQSAECRVQNAECRMQSSECRMQNAEFRMQNTEFRVQNSGILIYFDDTFVFLQIEINIAIISLISGSILLNSFSLRYPVAKSNFNQ